MTTGLIYLIGILIAAFIVYLMIEIVWERAPKGALADAYSTDGKSGSRLQGLLSPIGVPVQKYAPPSMLRKVQANLYWAQLAGKWLEWNAIQFIALQLVAAVGGFLLTSLLTRDPVMSLIAGYAGWAYPGMSVNGVARRTRRLFVSQLPEFVQLVAAQMAANVSMEEAIQRTSKSPGLVGQWMQNVLRQAQGRNLIEQMQREAQASLLPELIGMGVQIAFIRRGTAQQDLMNQLAMSIASGYIGEAEQRAEKLGSEMVVPMVIFYFLPFLATLLMVLAYPVMTNLFGGM
jgi:Flp pilus assembly protein TadB